ISTPPRLPGRDYESLISWLSRKKPPFWAKSLCSSLSAMTTSLRSRSARSFRVGAEDAPYLERKHEGQLFMQTTSQGTAALRAAAQASDMKAVAHAIQRAFDWFSQAEIELQDRISVRTFYVAAALVRAGVGLAVIDEFTARAIPGDDVAFCR